MTKSFFYSFLFLILFLPNLCRAMAEEEEVAATSDNQITLVERVIDACDTGLCELHTLMSDPSERLKLSCIFFGISLCLKVMDYSLGTGGSLGDYWFWHGMYLLLESGSLAIIHYYDNFTDGDHDLPKSDSLTIKHKKKRRGPINYNQARMRLYQGIKSSGLVMVSGFVLFDFGEQLHEFYILGAGAENIPLELVDIPAQVPAIWFMALGCTIYNLEQLLKNISGQKVKPHDTPIANFCGWMLFMNLIPKARAAAFPAICQQILERPGRHLDERNIEALLQLIKEGEQCIQIYRLSQLPLQFLSPHGTHIFLKEFTRITKNKVASLNTLLKNKRIVAQTWDMALALKEGHQSNAKVETITIPHDDLVSLIVRHDTNIERQEKPPLLLSEPIFPLPLAGIGNIKAPPKPRTRQGDIKDVPCAQLNERDEINYKKRLELIRETLTLACITQISEHQIFQLAARTARILEESEVNRRGTRASLKWKGAEGADGKSKRAYFNRSPGRCSNLAAAALKAILVALIFDLTDEEISLLEIDLLGTKSKGWKSFREALEIFYRQK